MEWLGEWDEDDIPADEDFYLREDRREAAVSGKLVPNKCPARLALQQMMSSVEHGYVNDPAAPGCHTGFAPWRTVL